MILTGQIESLWDEARWHLDSGFRSSLYQINLGQTSYGAVGGSDPKDYYAITPGIGNFVLYVTTDPANGFINSQTAALFTVNITDALGNLVLTSTVADLYTRGIAFQSTTLGTYYVEISSIASTPYAATLELNTSATLPIDPAVILSAVQDAFQYVLRYPAASASDLNYIAQETAALTVGNQTLEQAEATLLARAGATTSVATLAYQFFTGSMPSSAGLDYLVSPIGPNPNNLNSPYYQSFNLENRYINFAVNLGKLGAGAQSFNASYGNLSLFDATRAAYTTIFGSTPTDTKIHALIDTRADYFAAYGLDGPNGIGTKAAMVGWLMAEAVKADVGTYATANDAYLVDLMDGVAPYAVNLVGTYGGIPYTG